MTSVQLYWLLRCDDIRATIGFAASFFLIASVVCLIIWLMIGMAMTDSAKKKEWVVWRRCLYFIVIPLVLIGVVNNLAKMFVPSTKQMAVIYVVPRIVNSEGIKEIPKKLLNLTDEWLEELRPENIIDRGKLENDVQPEKKE